MKKILYFLSVLTVAGLFWALFPQTQGPAKKDKKAQTIKWAFEHNFERTKDLSLGYPPNERLLAALEQTHAKQKELYGLLDRGTIANPRWRERGPNNVGGRTRAILIDKSDPTRETLWAGGVAGGLWKCTNISAPVPAWEKVSDFLENMAVGALAQDPNTPLLMYMGTGEGYVNADAVQGLGIFRSVDGGDTWMLLPSTLNGNFRYCQELLVHPGTSDVYACTDRGLFRSQDQGISWTKVLGVGLGAGDFMYDATYASNGYIFVSNNTSIFRSITGNPNEWEKISKPPIPSGIGRVELAVCAADPNIMYAICEQGGGATPVYRSADGGLTWQTRQRPENNDGSEFTNGQAWYDLEIVVDPSNCEHVIAGGVPMRRTLTGGFNWEPFGNGVHVDQHFAKFDPDDPKKLYLGNDGGVYRVTFDDFGNPTFQNRNFGYNVTQYYACAMNPGLYSSQFLGGTQDNGSHSLNDWNLTAADFVWGGDGFECHIDQNQPNIQIVSSQFGNWGLSTNGGLNFSAGQSTNGGFYNPSDYDDEANILYAQTFDGDFYRWKIDDNTMELVDITGVGNLNVSTIKVDPNVPNRVYFGTFSGQIIRVDDAHTGSAVPGVSVGGVVGVISSIDIEVGNPDHILVTCSNYGLVNSIYETTTGGTPWIGVEGTDIPDNLPDMPVRWGIFNPNNAQQAMIATEAGVWTTELLDGAQTVWIPPMPDRGFPLVATYMLQTRASDKMVLAATHARGMFSTDVFSTPAARLIIDQIQYVGTPVYFQGDYSLNADTYLWNFGDGATSTEENAFHTYSQIGEYTVNLQINGGPSDSETLKVLPERPTPYKPGESDYSGDFEGFTEHYGANNISGSTFERGKSVLSGKDGTKSGQFAWVVGLSEIMQPNTHTMLYLPNFDLSEAGIYEFSFWGKFDLETGADGFRVEYSQDGGQNWEVLGGSGPNWYNTTNTGLDNGAFPEGTSYFSKKVANFTQFKINISDLTGFGKVAFRFVAKSDATGIAPGLAIDDVQITKYNGVLQTTLTEWTAAFSQSTNISLNWTTQPEYNCQRFEIYRSEDGKNYEKIEDVSATGKTTELPQTYEYDLLGQRNLYFFQLKVINENTQTGYFYEFWSPIRTVRRNLEGTEVFASFPNPFNGFVGLTFTDVVNAPVLYELFDVSGRRLAEGTLPASGATYLEAPLPAVGPGTYFLRVKIGDQEAQTLKLVGGL